MIPSCSTLPKRAGVCMKPSTLEWVKKAEADYLAALTLSRKKKVPLHDAACFHCQQSAEKYLKARIEEHGIRVPKTHDLDAFCFPFSCRSNPYGLRCGLPCCACRTAQCISGIRAMKRRCKIYQNGKTRRQSGAEGSSPVASSAGMCPKTQ